VQFVRGGGTQLSGRGVPCYDIEVRMCWLDLSGTLVLSPRRVELEMD